MGQLLASVPLPSTAEVVRIRALDSVIRLEIADPAVAERIRREWSRCLVAEPDPAELVLAFGTDKGLGQGSTYALASRVTRLAIEASVGRYVMFHAAALTNERGRVVVLVAPSGTGKTTAAATLGVARFGYVTDEAVAVTDDGVVLPYPKPLSIVRPGEGKAQHSPDDLGLASCGLRPTLGGIVLLDRVEGDHRCVPRLESVDLLDSLLALLPQTSALLSRDRPLQRLCELIDRAGGVFRLTYTEIASAGDILEALLRDQGDVDVNNRWTPLVPSSSAGAEDVGGTLGQLHEVTRGAVLDAIQVGEEGLLLVGQTPARLSGLGLTIWRAAERGASIEALADAAVREHGPHPRSDVMVRCAIERMRLAGVLSVVSAPGSQFDARGLAHSSSREVNGHET